MTKNSVWHIEDTHEIHCERNSVGERGKREVTEKTRREQGEEVREALEGRAV